MDEDPARFLIPKRRVFSRIELRDGHESSGERPAECQCRSVNSEDDCLYSGAKDSASGSLDKSAGPCRNSKFRH